MRGLRKSAAATSRLLVAAGDQPGDLELLRREPVQRAPPAARRALAGGPQLVARPLGPGLGARRLERLERGPQRRARLGLAPRAAQPLADQQLGPRAVERAPVAVVEPQRLGERASPSAWSAAARPSERSASGSAQPEPVAPPRRRSASAAARASAGAPGAGGRLDERGTTP